MSDSVYYGLDLYLRYYEDNRRGWKKKGDYQDELISCHRHIDLENLISLAECTFIPEAKAGKKMTIFCHPKDDLKFKLLSSNRTKAFSFSVEFDNKPKDPNNVAVFTKYTRHDIPLVEDELDIIESKINKIGEMK